MECNFENCGYYVDEECTICGMGTSGEDTFCRLCKDNPRCYYKQLSELKTENKELAHYLACMTEQRNKANTCLQEIKAIAKHEIKELTDSAINGGRYLDILNLITKAEEE